jgi:hypothetical protein
MNCPRCHVQVPAEAARCPGCKLPKPKRLHDTGSRPAAKVRKKQKKERSKSASIMLSVVLGIVFLFLGAVFYIFILPMLSSSGPEAQAAISMVTKLRSLPSTVEGKTVGEYMADEMAKSKRVGNLMSYQGWTTKPLKGTKTRFLIVFSYEEQGNVVQRAEWIADLNANTFTPTTELAVACYNNK